MVGWVAAQCYARRLGTATLLRAVMLLDAVLSATVAEPFAPGTETAPATSTAAAATTGTATAAGTTGTGMGTDRTCWVRPVVVACIWIAAKYEDDNDDRPGWRVLAGSLSAAAGGGCDAAAVRRAEAFVLAAVGYRVSFPTAHDFVRVLWCGCTLRRDVYALALYLCTLSLFDRAACTAAGSCVAAAALSVACHALGTPPPWTLPPFRALWGASCADAAVAWHAARLVRLSGRASDDAAADCPLAGVAARFATGTRSWVSLVRIGPCAVPCAPDRVPLSVPPATAEPAPASTLTPRTSPTHTHPASPRETQHVATSARDPRTPRRARSRRSRTDRVTPPRGPRRLRRAPPCPWSRAPWAARRASVARSKRGIAAACGRP